MNREPVGSLSDTAERLTEIEPGDSAFLLVLREGRRVFIVLARPD